MCKAFFRCVQAPCGVSPSLTGFFQLSTSEQHTATDLVKLLFFLRPVSSDHTDFVREFYQAKMDTRNLFYT